MISVSSGNQFSQFDTERFTITVEENPAPSFTSSPNKSGKEKSQYSYNISVNDNNRNSIELSVVDKPPFLSFTDNGRGNGYLQGTPGYNYAGTYAITIKASDNNSVDPKSTTQTYSLKINDKNRAPDIKSNAPTSGKEGSKYMYGVNADDPDEDSVSYEKLEGPGWLSFSGSRLQGTPGYSDSGSKTVKIRVKDGKGGTETQEYTLTITNTNRSPEIKSDPTTSGKEGEKYSYAVDADDPDGNNVSYEKLEGPGWLSFSGNKLQGTPSYSDAGTYDIKVKVDDGNKDGIDTQQYILKIKDINRDPDIQKIENKSVDEDDPFSYSVTAGDPDGDPITYSRTGGPNWLSFSGSKLQGTPGYSDSGTYTVRVKVEDDRGGSSTVSFELKVMNVNRAPDIKSKASTSVNEGKKYTYAVDADDPDDDNMTYSKESGPNWLSFSGRTLQGTPGYSDTGKYAVKIKVTDSNKASDTESFDLTVRNINRAPDITSSPTDEVDEGSKYNYAIKASDKDGDSINISYEQGPSWLSLSDKTLSGTPGFNASGEYSITVKVDDGNDNNNNNTQSYKLTVREVDREPEFTSDPVTKVTEKEKYSYSITVFDADGDNISISAAQKGGWMTFKDNGNGTATLSGTPNAEQSGSYQVTLQAGNGGNQENADSIKAEQSFTVDVVDVGGAPNITSTPPEFAKEEAVYTYNITSTDPDGDAINFEYVEGPQWLSISKADPEAGTSTLSGTPPAKTTGKYTMKIEATDDSEKKESSSQQYTLAVGTGNTPPNFTSQPVEGAAIEKPYHYAITTTDQEEHSVTFSMESAPEFLALIDEKPEAGQVVLAGTPAPGDIGDHKIILTATDNGDPKKSSQQEFTLTVSKEIKNTAPNFSSEPVKSMATEEGYRYAIKATDQEGNAVTFSLESGPEFLSLTDQKPKTGEAVLAGTAAAGDAGEHEIAITATDDGDPQQSVRQQFTLTVIGKNSAPKITSIPGKSVSSGLQYRYVITASDKDDDLSDEITLTATRAGGKALPKFLSLKEIATEDPDVFQKELAGTPEEGDIGKYQIVIIAMDDQGETDNQSFELTVTQGNRAPTFSSQPTTTAQTGSQYRYEITISDPDEDSLQYSATLSGEDELPDWLAFEQDVIPILTGIPDESDLGEYQIVITARDNGEPAKEKTQEFTLEVTLEDITELRVFYNYPNPFQQQTRIKFALPSEGNVSIELYNTGGSLIRRTESKNYKAGVNEILIEARNMQSGIYIYRLISNEKVETGRMTLIR